MNQPLKPAFWVLLVCCVFGQYAAGNDASPANCDLVDFHGQKPLMNGTLSPFWAQEYIGADLASQALHDVDGLSLVPVGVIDGSFNPEFLTGNVAADAKIGDLNPNGDNHGTAVANLINGQSPIGIAASAELRLLARGRGVRGNQKALQKMDQAGVQIINISQELHDSLLTKEALKKSAEHALVVVAAGNEYPMPITSNNALESNIVVGNLNATGLISLSTREGPTVTIMAPSDRLIQSIRDGRGIQSFSGTSAAAPVVSGALANVLSILPDMTSLEVKMLLRKTAVKTLNARQNPQMNGVGMVNAYKLVEVAKRLKRLGWPSGRAELLDNPSTFDFRETAAAYLREGHFLLDEADCKDQKRGFDLVRAAFLLDESEIARKILVNRFAKMNLITNAEFYSSFDELQVTSDVIARIGKPDTGPLSAESLYKSIAIVGSSAIPGVVAAWNSDDLISKRHAAIAAEHLGEDSQLADIVNSAATDLDSQFRADVMFHAWRMGARAIPLLQKALSDSAEDVRKGATASASLLGIKGATLLESALADESEEVRIAALAYADFYRNSNKGRVYRTALNNASAAVRVNAASMCSGLGSEGFAILDLARADKDPRVRISAAGAYAGLIFKGLDGLPFFAKMFVDSDKAVRREVLRQIVSIWREEFSVRALGQDGVQFLNSFLDDPEVDPKLRQQIPLIVADIQKPE